MLVCSEVMVVMLQYAHTAFLCVCVCVCVCVFGVRVCGCAHMCAFVRIYM